MSNSPWKPGMEQIHQEPHYLPTPEEIEAAAAEIRAGWSATDRKRRQCWSDDPYTIPEVGRGKWWRGMPLDCEEETE